MPEEYLYGAISFTIFGLGLIATLILKSRSGRRDASLKDIPDHFPQDHAQDQEAHAFLGDLGEKPRKPAAQARPKGPSKPEPKAPPSFDHNTEADDFLKSIKK